MVIDSDGSAFVTKAEFDALKNSFQKQISNYNTSIDNKIDGAIASYLSGMQTVSIVDIENYYDRLSVTDAGSDIYWTGQTDFVVNKNTEQQVGYDGYALVFGVGNVETNAQRGGYYKLTYNYGEDRVHTKKDADGVNRVTSISYTEYYNTGYFGCINRYQDNYNSPMYWKNTDVFSYIANKPDRYTASCNVIDTASEYNKDKGASSHELEIAYYKWNEINKVASCSVILAPNSVADEIVDRYERTLAFTSKALINPYSDTRYSGMSGTKQSEYNRPTTFKSYTAASGDSYRAYSFRDVSGTSPRCDIDRKVKLDGADDKITENELIYDDFIKVHEYNQKIKDGVVFTKIPAAGNLKLTVNGELDGEIKLYLAKDKADTYASCDATKKLSQRINAKMDATIIMRDLHRDDIIKIIYIPDYDVVAGGEQVAKLSFSNCGLEVER